MGNKIEHPSFGQIKFARVASNIGARFYGSEIPQDNYISLEIHESYLDRELTRDRYFTKKPIIRVRMSANQFAETITSLNIGGGIPCTIEQINGVRIAELPEEKSRKEYVHSEFKERMSSFAAKLKENQIKAKSIVKKKTLSKDDIHELLTHLDVLTQEITSNIPFFIECFQEATDVVVNEAKMEVENAILHKITSLGLNELHNQQKLLNEPK